MMFPLLRCCALMLTVVTATASQLTGLLQNLLLVLRQKNINTEHHPTLVFSSNFILADATHASTSFFLYQLKLYEHLFLKPSQSGNLCFQIYACWE